MGADAERDTDRTAVKTYVPVFQKESWVAHADDLGMSQSEFVRTMVQAGRRGFDLPSEGGDLEGHSPPSHPGGGGLEDRLLAVLSTDEYMSWSQLLDAVTGDLEDRLDDTLSELQSAGKIRHSGRHDGYTLVEDGVDRGR